MEIYNKLTEYIKKSNNIIISTHKNPDLDGIASAICLYEIIKEFKKNIKIYIPKKILNKSVNKALQLLNEKGLLVEFTNKIDYNDLLIILDVNKIELLDNKNIISKFENIIVIDHHMKGNNYIEGTINYINSNLSSIAEFMTDYSKYLNKKLNPYLATILLAAIEIDTNNYLIKTNEKTHLAASHLYIDGADNILKQSILKENMNTFLKRQELIKNTIINNDIAICIFDTNNYNKEDLALSSEELISFEGIETSFTIGKLTKDTIGISARSTGKINVEEVMKKLQGGGHATEAATELKNMTLSDAKEKLLEALK